MKRGDVSTFDESVNVDISEYRKIKKKLTLVDSLIISLAIERYQGEQAIKANLFKADQLNEIISRQEDTIRAKDITIQALSGTTDQATRIGRKLLRISPNPWIDTPIKVGAGVVIGLIVHALISR